MKKFLCFGVLLAALAATVGCDDKKSTPAAGGGSKSSSAPSVSPSTTKT